MSPISSRIREKIATWFALGALASSACTFALAAFIGVLIAFFKGPFWLPAVIVPCSAPAFLFGFLTLKIAGSKEGNTSELASVFFAQPPSAQSANSSAEEKREDKTRGQRK